jgi:hypothetical protein
MADFSNIIEISPMLVTRDISIITQGTYTTSDTGAVISVDPDGQMTGALISMDAQLVRKRDLTELIELFAAMIRAFEQAGG